MADFALDYIDVATRIVEFRGKHPDGSLQQVAIDFREVNGTWWVIYTAAAYRSPDDPRPGHGTAWECIPGRTPFTKFSEVQNAETAAWGRAIVAVLAADTKRGIASAEEVRGAQARQHEPPPPPPNPNGPLIDEIFSLAQRSPEGPAAVLQQWQDDHDGQHISQAADVGGLELLRDDLTARIGQEPPA